MQTTPFRQEIAAYLIKKAKDHGIILTLSPLQGFSPLRWSFAKATLQLQDGKEIELSNTELKVSLLPILRRHVFIQSLSIEKLNLTFAPIEELDVPFRPIKTTNLPFDFTAKSLRIKELTFSKSKELHNVSFCLLGKVKVSQDFEEIALNLILQEPLPQNSFHLELLSSKKKDLIRGKMFCSIQDSQPLSTFLHLPWQITTETSLRCDGKWSYWQELKKRKMGDPLSCSFRSHITPYMGGKNPFLEQTWDLGSEVLLYPNLSFSCDHLHVESQTFRGLGKVSISSSLSPVEGSLIVSLSDLSTLSSSLQGKVDIKAGLSKEAFLMSLYSDNILIDSVPFSQVEAKAKASLEEIGWQGALTYSLQNPSFPCKGSSDFLLTSSFLSLENFDLSLQNNEVSGNIRFDKTSKSSRGAFFIRAPELKAFRTFFPSSSLEGKIGGNCSFSYADKDLSLTTHLVAKNVRYQSTLVNTTEIDLEATKLLTDPQGDLFVSCKSLLARGGEISDLTLNLHGFEKGLQTYAIQVQGIYKEPFSLSSSGSFTIEKEGFTLSSKTCQGLGFHQPFQTSPFTLSKKENVWSLQNYELLLGSGSFTIEAIVGKEKAFIQTKALHLPLDIISLLYPSIGLSGSASFHGEFTGTPFSSAGQFLATLEEAYLPNMQAKGSLQAHFSSDTAQLHMHLYATENQFIDFTATFPTNYPFGNAAYIDTTKPVYGELTAEGKLHHLFDFLKVANQKIEGWISSHLFLSGTIDAPYLQGHMKIEEGLYENYPMGVRLAGIYADIAAFGHELYLQDIHFQDRQKGTAKGQGSLLLNTQEQFPFNVHLALQECSALDSPFLQITTSGNLELIGNTSGCLAKGDLQVDKAVFVLSEKLPIEIPTLPITYINKPIHLEQSELIPSPGYPLQLQLELSSQDTITLKGRGLDSIWKGNLTVTGTPTKITSKGTLTLDKGEFTFSGKSFSLTRGEITFSNRQDQGAHLSLSGELKLPSATIIANLQGPLSSPRLTFQSVPQLSTSSILSLMLFNKDVSEINTLQALQLAQVIMSLSGNGGPDVLGAIRKTIGVDKFQISGKEGTDEIALQIGWCVAHGVTVSLSQSPSSSDITVEVDLKNGFVFEAESQNQEEGKFSLKWNCNY